MENPNRSDNLDKRKGLMAIMRLFGKMMPAGENGENKKAVHAYHFFEQVKETLSGRSFVRFWKRLVGKQPWPVVSGDYTVGQFQSPVAICTLRDEKLMKSLGILTGVAIAGRLHVPNLGIEKIISNVVSNPHIRFLVLCGMDSTVFHAGQSLVSLMENGVDDQCRIIGAKGHLPVLANVSSENIDCFRRQVELVNCLGEGELPALQKVVSDLVARNPSPFKSNGNPAVGKSLGRGSSINGAFKVLAPGGKRERAEYDAKGFFVVSLDPEARQIVLYHYFSDNTPGHEVRSRSGDAILRAIIREGLVSQLSHTGYLGRELSKAETALRLNLLYEQDKPLKEPVH